MAGAKEIKQKIVLEGEKEYSQAIKDANRNLKTLKSELKAETAELGRNATAQQKSETKAKSLQKQIKEQEKVVKTLRAALEEVKEKYGDNEDEIAKWEQKLNSARTTLASMQNDLSATSEAITKTGTSLRDAADGAAEGVTATKSFADALDNISTIGESVSGALEGIFEGMFSKMTAAAEKLWALISETAAKANNWTDLGSYYGSNAEAMQLWSNSIEMAQGSFTDFIAIVNKMSFGTKNDKITEWFGISDVNYTDKLKYTVAVMSQMAKYKDEMTEAGTWDNALQEAFGTGDAQKISWFVSNWETIQEAQESINEHGFGMGEEELSTMNDIWVKLGEIETKWDMLKSKFAAGFGTISLDIMTNVSGALDALADLINAEPGSAEETAALEALQANIEEACVKAAEAIEKGLEALNSVGERLSGSDNPYVAAIGEMLQTLTSSLQWMIDNKDAVKGALETIFGVWLIAKLAAVAGKLGSIIGQIETIKAFKDWKIASAAGAGSGGTAAEGAAAGGAAGKASSILTSTAAKIVGGVAAFGATLFKNAYTHQGNDDMYQDDEGNWRRVDDNTLANENYKRDGAIVLDLGEKPVIEVEEDEDLDPTYTDADKETAFQDWWDAWRNAANDEDSWEEEEKAYDYMSEVFGEEFGAVMENIIHMLDNEDDQNSLDDLPSSWWQSVTDGSGDQITSSDISGFRSLPELMREAVKIGASSGVSGIKVEIDGQYAGRILAPYVSEEIARSM